MNYLLLILFSVLLAMGQILFKKAALASNAIEGLFGLLNPWLLAALTLYVFATALWVWVLKTTPLSAAYPFAALGFVLVPLASYLLFQEPISLKYLIGSALIVSGILVIGTTA